jgi:hypothetical protein
MSEQPGMIFAPSVEASIITKEGAARSLFFQDGGAFFVV